MVREPRGQRPYSFQSSELSFLNVCGFWPMGLKSLGCWNIAQFPTSSYFTDFGTCHGMYRDYSFQFKTLQLSANQNLSSFMWNNAPLFGRTGGDASSFNQTTNNSFSTIPCAEILRLRYYALPHDHWFYYTVLFIMQDLYSVIRQYWGRLQI